MADSPILGFTYNEQGQNLPEVTHNDSLNAIEGFVIKSVEDITLNSPPGGETNGQVWWIGGTATGDWAGEDNNLALYYDGWIFITPPDGYIAWDKTSQRYIRWQASDSTLRGYKTGNGITATIASDADTLHDWNITAGFVGAANGEFAVQIATEFTKRADATWAAGDNNGGMFTGSLSATTEYHFFVIFNLTTGAIDAGWDTSTAGANVPAGWAIVRRVASQETDGSSDFRPFDQVPNSNRFLFRVPFILFTTANPGTSSVTAGIGHVPGGVNALGLLTIRLEDAAGPPTDTTYLIVRSGLQTDTAPTASVFTIFVDDPMERAFAHLEVHENSSGQWFYRIGTTSDADKTVEALVQGFVDERLV